MSTLEKLFVQIFDRKKWIEDQLKQQRDLYDQYLASTLLINGIRPPSWLLSSGFEGGSAEIKELKKEELIAGLLFPPKRSNIPIGRSTIYRRPAVTENNTREVDDLITETCASSKYFDVGVKSTLVSKCDINSNEHDMGNTLKGVPELDQTNTSPQNQTDVRTADTNFEPDQSLSRIQRSRSRQKALELRNSASTKSNKRLNEDSSSAVSARITRLRTSGHPTHAKELPELLNFSNISNGRVTRSRFAAQKLNSDKPLQSTSGADGEDHHNPVVSKAIVRSSSSQENLELHDFVGANITEHSNKGDFVDGRCIRLTTTVMTHLRTSCGDGLLKPGNSFKVPSGRVTRSRSTSSNKFSQGPNPSDHVEGHDLLKASDAQPTTVLCNDGSVIVHQERLNTEVAETELVSEPPVEVGSYHARSNNMAGSLGMAREVLIPDPLAGTNMYVEPKKLHFDEVEDRNLAGCSSPDPENPEKGKRYDSSEMGVMPLEPTESLRKLIVSNDLHEKHFPSADSELLEKDQDLKSAIREENCWASSDALHNWHNGFITEKSDCDFHLASTEKTSKLSLMSSREEAQNYEHTVADAPESNKVSVQDLVESSKKLVSSTDIQEKSGLAVDLELSEGDQINDVVNSNERRASLKAFEEENLEFIKEKSDCCLHPVLSTSKTLNGSPLPTGKGTPEVYETDTFSGSNRISKQARGPSDDLIALQVARKSSFASQLEGEADTNLPDLDMKPQKVSFGDICPQILDAKSDDKIFDEECALDVDGCDGAEKSMIPGPNFVTGFSLAKNYDMSFGEQESECAAATDAAISSIQRQSSTPKSIQVNNTTQEAPYFLRSYNTLKKNNGCSRSNRSCFANKPMQCKEMIHDVTENSWPQYKRRKIDDQSSIVITTPLKLGRVKPLGQIDEDNPNRFFKNVKDGSGSDQQLQHFSPSFNVEVAHSNSIERPDTEMYRSEKRRKTDRYGSSSQVLAKEGDGEIEVEDQYASIPLGVKESLVEGSLISSVEEEANGNSQHHSQDKEGSPDYSKMQFVSENHRPSPLPKSELNFGRKEVAATEETLQEKTSDIGDLLFPYRSVSYTHEDHDLNVADQSMPEFEGFSIGVPTESIMSSLAEDSISLEKLDLPSTSSERISVLEQLCRSTSFTPLPQSSKYKLQKTPNVYQSLPNGLLECMNLRSTVLFNDDEIKQLKASYNLMGAEVDQASYSDHLPSSNVQFDWGVRKPPTPPVRKFRQIITSLSTVHSSERKQSVNPELTCFRIDEDTGTCEGNGNLDEVLDLVEERLSPRDNNSSTNRDPFVDMTNINPSASVSVSEMFHDRGSLASVNTQLNFHGTQAGAKQKMRNGSVKNRRSKNNDKENQCSSIGANGASRPNVLRKASEQKESQSFLEKGYKRTNIVSNISSFVPLVQQKHQPAALITGKRDIKVKALEAAEAAKRLEEKRENDRKMKKEAAKVERARLEQEKIKQLELNQKKKEEERKKKEADMATKKRLREEEERKERGKKRKCIEEARRQQKEEKLRAVKEDKEQQCRAADELEGKRKGLQNEGKKYQKTEKGRETAECRQVMENRSADLSVGNATKASDVHELSEAFKMSPDKGESNLCRESGYRFSFIGGSGEKSYEISPYQASEDEEDEEEEDERPKKKFTPSWAREKNLASVLPSMQEIDTSRIFPRTSFCSVAEVLLPRMIPK